MGNRKSRNGSDALHEQTTKAIRRGEKFAKTLTQVVGQHDQSSPFKALLRSVETGLNKLRRYASGGEALGHALPVKKTKKAKKAESPEAVVDLPVTSGGPEATKAKSRTPKKAGNAGAAINLSVTPNRPEAKAENAEASSDPTVRSDGPKAKKARSRTPKKVKAPIDQPAI